MKKLLLLSLLLLGCAPAFASELDQFFGDTHEVAGKHYEGFYGFDFIDYDHPKERIAIGSQIIAYRVLAIQPTLSYAPNASGNVVNIELIVPIRLNRLPIGGGRLLGDLIPKDEIGGWIDKISGGFYAGYNISKGGANFGWRAHFGNGK